MRNITIVAGVLAFALLATPAKADPENNTSNNIFVVFNFGGFDSSVGDDEEYQLYSYEYENSNLFIVNLASIDGTLFAFEGLSFGDFGELPDLSELEYFVLGHITGSEHLVLGADGEAEPIPDDFEDPLIDAARNMDTLDDGLEAPGGTAFVSPEDFADHFGVGVETFVEPNPDIPFDMVASVGDDSGVGLNGFTDPFLFATLIIDFEDGQLIARVPEPGLAILAVVGIAGAVISRRRRRAAA